MVAAELLAQAAGQNLPRLQEAAVLIAGADIDTEQPQQLAPATHQRPVQRFHPHGRHRRTATTLDSAPGSGTFGAVEAAPMLDSSRHADAGNRAAGPLVDCLNAVVCSALV
jgi:hypothetical protein